MYITPQLLRDAQLGRDRRCARWSRANAATLADTHWVGGDPAQLEVYGWAAWSPQGAMLTLRNPSGRVQSIGIEPRRAFELPEGARTTLTLRSPWRADRGRASVILRGGATSAITLEAFEVLTLTTDTR